MKSDYFKIKIFKNQNKTKQKKKFEIFYFYEQFITFNIESFNYFILSCSIDTLLFLFITFLYLFYFIVFPEI